MRKLPLGLLCIVAVLFYTKTVTATDQNIANIFDYRGKFIGKIQTSHPNDRPLPIALTQTQTVTRNNESVEVAVGIYFIAPPDFTGSISSPLSIRNFGFEDVTEEYLPNEELEAGDIETADVNGDGKEDIIFSLNTFICDSTTDYRPRIWIQTTDGSFVDETLDRMPDVSTPANDIELFDADLDGDMDIFVTGFSCETILIVKPIIDKRGLS